MARYQRRDEPREDDWLITALEEDGAFDYNSKRDPNSAEYSSVFHVDYRAIREREVIEFEGKPCRIDLIFTPQGPAKRIWNAGWMPGDRATSSGPLKAGWTIESAAADMERQGWTVRRFNGKARCWRLGVRPVRNQRQLEYYKELVRRQRAPIVADPRLDG